MSLGNASTHKCVWGGGVYGCNPSLNKGNKFRQTSSTFQAEVRHKGNTKIDFIVLEGEGSSNFDSFKEIESVYKLQLKNAPYYQLLFQVKMENQ